MMPIIQFIIVGLNKFLKCSYIYILNKNMVATWEAVREVIKSLIIMGSIGFKNKRISYLSKYCQLLKIKELI